jgi:hypothetical protein
MKKLFLNLILILICNIVKADDFRIVKLQNTNLVIAVPNNEAKDKAIYIFQLHDKNIEINKNVKNCTIKNSENCISFVSEGVEVESFNLDDSEKGIFCYGIIKLGDDELLSCMNEVEDIFTKVFSDEIIKWISKAWCVKNGGNADGCTCSGGAGSTQCECGGGIASATWSSGVTCGAGYFACCAARMNQDTKMPSCH